MHEEPWVECSQCNRWVHQICALFNGRMNKGTTIYHCPFCFMAQRGKKDPHPRPLGAKDIRHTKLSRFLEDRVIKSLQDVHTRNSTTSPSKPTPVYVRQLSNLDKMHQVKPKILKRYSQHKYPCEFPMRSNPENRVFLKIWFIPLESSTESKLGIESVFVSWLYK